MTRELLKRATSSKNLKLPQMNWIRLFAILPGRWQRRKHSDCRPHRPLQTEWLVCFSNGKCDRERAALTHAAFNCYLPANGFNLGFGHEETQSLSFYLKIETLVQ